MTTTLTALQEWVDSVAGLTQPDSIHWCDGSDAEFDRMIANMCDSDVLSPLNKDTFPNCHLHLSDPSDVARVEHLTFVCTESQEDAGPNNNWMAPADAHKKIDALFAGAMKGRTLYVIPYCMGPIDSPYARLGVEITDSAYVVANMRLMTRMGQPALQRIEKEGSFVKGLHSTGDLDPERRFIMHFPEELSIKSIGSGYGGNALLGKKCHALRIASYQARNEGWLAEHMLIVGVENPHGEVHYVACAFPSACGKTNLAMLIPPESHKGWRIWTLGDDIAWLHLDEGGKLRAINPEAGYFGVVPGTNEKTNKNAYDMIHRDTIFTNVATTADNEPWWEDKKTGTPTTDWQGRKYDPSQRSCSAPQFPLYCVREKQSLLFETCRCAGRRADFSDCLRRPPQGTGPARLRGERLESRCPRGCGSGIGDDRRKCWRSRCRAPRPDGDEAVSAATTLPITGVTGCHSRIAQNDCRKFFTSTGSGRTMTANSCGPGFGENLRVIRWIIERCEERAHAHKTPIGFLPNPADIDTSGLDISFETMKELLSVNTDAWREEMDSIGEYLDSFGDRLPERVTGGTREGG